MEPTNLFVTALIDPLSSLSFKLFVSFYISALTLKRYSITLSFHILFRSSQISTLSQQVSVLQSPIPLKTFFTTTTYYRP